MAVLWKGENFWDGLENKITKKRFYLFYTCLLISIGNEKSFLFA